MATNRLSASTLIMMLATVTIACGATAPGEDHEDDVTAAPLLRPAASPPADPEGARPGVETRSEMLYTSDPCDVDGDGFRSARCGGGDCCDTDASAYPGSERFFPVRNACGNYDYNCDGYEEPIAGVDIQCHMTGLRCEGGGFVTVTPCGVVNTFVTCKWSFGCKEREIQRIQECH